MEVLFLRPTSLYLRGPFFHAQLFHRTAPVDDSRSFLQPVLLLLLINYKRKQLPAVAVGTSEKWKTQQVLSLLST